MSGCPDERRIGWLPAICGDELTIGSCEILCVDHGLRAAPEQLGPVCPQVVGEPVELFDERVVQLN